MASLIEKLRAHPGVMFVVVAAIAVAAWFIHGMTTVTEKERIEQTIDGVATAIEAQDVAGVMGHFSPAYGDKGGLTHDNMKTMLPDVFNGVKIRSGSWSFLEPPKINAKRRLASIRIHVQSVVVIEVVGRPFPVTSVWEIELERPGKGWKVTSANPVEVNVGRRDAGKPSSLRGLMRRAISELNN